MDKIKLKPRVRQADSFNDSKATSVKGSYHIGAWDIVSSENPASVSLSHPRFEDITFTGSEAQEVFSEVSAIAQANGCSAEDAWRHFLSRYLVLDSVQGKKSSSLGASTKMPRMQRLAMDSADDSAKVYTMRFHDMEQAFATGLPAGYKFIGTGVAFITNTRKRAHTIDFRNMNLDEDAEGATIEVPYDANTGTVAKVKEDLANMVAAMSTKTFDAATKTRVMPKRQRLSVVKSAAAKRHIPIKLQDSGDSPIADYDDVLAIFTAKRLSGFTYHEDGRIFVDLSTNAAKALGLTDLPYNLQVTFEAEGVEDDSSSVENKWWDRESVPVASVDVSLMKRADALSREWDESLCGWYIPTGQSITQADVTAIADAFRQVVDTAPQTIELVTALLRSALPSFKFYEDASAVSSTTTEVTDAAGGTRASLQDVINLGITYNLVPRILILSDSVGFVSAVNLPNGDRLPYSVLLSFKGVSVDASTAKANKRDLKVRQVFMQLETTSGLVTSKWESLPDVIFDLTQVEDLLILFRSVSENCTSLDEVLSQLQSSLSTSFVKSK